MKIHTSKSAITVTSYIAMGSNLYHPKKQLIQGLKHLYQLPKSKLIGCSKLYKSLPLGPKNQLHFYNAVIALNTSLSPKQLLNQLQMIEKLHNRERKIHWGPRTLDLDILLYGNHIIKAEQLIIPHSQMYLRNFVLFPLSDIDATLMMPCGRKISFLCQQVGSKGLWVEQNTFFDQIRSNLKSGTAGYKS